MTLHGATPVCAKCCVELAIEGHRVRYAALIEPGGHEARLRALVARVERDTGHRLGGVLAAVESALSEDDSEAAVVRDAAAEIIDVLDTLIEASPT